MSAMSAQAPEKVRHPEGLSLPSKEKIKRVMPFLTAEGQRIFLEEVLESLADAKDTGDLSHVNHVVEAWYRTLLFKMDPEHQERWERAQRLSDEGGMDIEEVSRRLDLA